MTEAQRILPMDEGHDCRSFAEKSLFAMIGPCDNY